MFTVAETDTDRLIEEENVRLKPAQQSHIHSGSMGSTFSFQAYGLCLVSLTLLGSSLIVHGPTHPHTTQHEKILCVVGSMRSLRT